MKPTRYFEIQVGEGGPKFVPNNVTASVGDTIQFVWATYVEYLFLLQSIFLIRLLIAPEATTPFHKRLSRTHALNLQVVSTAVSLPPPT
jgi:hypothetical protein